MGVLVKISMTDNTLKRKGQVKVVWTIRKQHKDVNELFHVVTYSFTWYLLGAR